MNKNKLKIRIRDFFGKPYFFKLNYNYIMKKNTYLFVCVVFAMIQSSFSQETIDLFIWAGQSNAIGIRGNGHLYPQEGIELDNSVRFNQTLMRNYENNDRNWGRPFSTGGWVDSMRIQDGFWNTNEAGEEVGHFGAEVTFSRDLVAEGYNPAIFKFGQGSTSLYDEWMGLNPNNDRANYIPPGGTDTEDRRLLSEMFRRLREAIKELQDAEHTVIIRGFIWIQGEHDAISDDEEDAKPYFYHERLTQLINEVREYAKDVNNNNNDIPVILGVDEQHSNVEEFPTVHNAHQNIAKRDANTIFTSMVGFSKFDATHLDAAGLIRQGKHIYDNYRLLIGEKTKAQINEEFKAEILESENDPDIETIVAPVDISVNGTFTSGGRVSWGQSFKPNFFGELNRFRFASDTAVDSDFTFTIYNGPDCYGDRDIAPEDSGAGTSGNVNDDSDDIIYDDGIIYSQTFDGIVIGNNDVVIPEGLELEREHTYFVQITSLEGVEWQARYYLNDVPDIKNIYGNLRSSNVSNTLACGRVFPDYDLKFRAFFEETTLSDNSIQKLLDDTYMYPNPTESIVSIRLNNLKGVSIKVMGINGKTLYSKNNINALTHEIDLSNITRGIYFVQINSQGYQQVQKLVLK